MLGVAITGTASSRSPFCARLKRAVRKLAIGFGNRRILHLACWPSRCLTVNCRSRSHANRRVRQQTPMGCLLPRQGESRAAQKWCFLPFASSGSPRPWLDDAKGRKQLSLTTSRSHTNTTRKTTVQRIAKVFSLAERSEGFFCGNAAAQSASAA